MSQYCGEDLSIKYERNNNISYAVVDITDSNELVEYEMKMLMRNRPDYFLQFSINEINSRKCIYYDITSKQQLSTLLEYGKVNMSDVQSLLGNISKMARVVNEYMLNLDRVILDPGCIYISLVAKKVYFMYSLLDNNTDFYGKMRSLYEYILERFDHSIEKIRLVKFYEAYQRILVRDYTPYNLMQLFEDNEDESNSVDKSGSDNTAEGGEYSNIINNTEGMAGSKVLNNADSVVNCRGANNNESTVNSKFRRKSDSVPDFSSQRNINKGSSADEPHTDIKDKRSYANGKILSAVRPEPVGVEEHNKCIDKKTQLILKAVAVLLLYNSAASLLFRSYAVVKLDTVVSAALLIAGIVLFYIADKAGVLVGDLKQAKSENVNEIPYRFDLNEEIDNKLVTAEVIKDNEGNVDNRAEECEHTILLSDYLKSLAEEDNKNNKLCLQGLTDDLFPDVRPDNGEYDNVNNTIGLCKFPCTVGSIREASDVYIDNPVISKLHACFSYGDKGFFVEDMNSTNGTYINGERLKVHTRVNINNGDILKFAAYEFKVSIV